MRELRRMRCYTNGAHPIRSRTREQYSIFVIVSESRADMLLDLVPARPSPVGTLHILQ